MSSADGQLLEEVQSLRGAVSELKTENEILRLKIRALELAQARPVKGGDDPNQLALEIEHTESMSVEQEPAGEPEPDSTVPHHLPSSTTRRGSKKRIRGAEKFDHIAVKKTTVYIPREVETHPDQWKEIGEEVTYEVIVEPATVYRHRIIRKKYRSAIDRSASPIIAKAPARFCSDYASTSLAVHIAIGKYLDHGSLNRLQKQFARMGVDIPRQTQSDIVQRMAMWIRPLYEEINEHIDKSGYIQIDETFIRYINGRLSGSGQGYFWAKIAPALGMVYKWIPNRRHENVATLVDGFSGLLQSDGYAAYANYADTRDDINLAACWAHAFRKFREALSEEPVLAKQAMAAISKLYDLEEQWNRDGIDPQQRKALRADKSMTIANAFKSDLDAWLADNSLLKGSFRTAVAYTLSQWQGLLECLRHGHTFLDTNQLESKFRPTKIGERNWTFIGHPEAGEKSAIIYSILSTCQIHRIEPRAYLQDALDQLVQLGPEPTPTQLEPLLPWNWIAAHPEALIKEPAAH